MFDWIVSPASLAEIDAAGDASRSSYARDVLDHSQVCLAEDPPAEEAKSLAEIVEGPSFGNVSLKDRRLLVEAAALGCDHFLTIDMRLAGQASVILKRVPLLVATPMTLWEKLRPHLKGL